MSAPCRPSSVLKLVRGLLMLLGELMQATRRAGSKDRFMQDGRDSQAIQVIDLRLHLIKRGFSGQWQDS